MKKNTEVEKKAIKPSKELVEKVARQLCKQAGMNPDDVDTWEGEYGYKDYHFPKWQRFAAEARKRIAKGEADA